MKLIWHILKKDFRAQYLTSLLWILCGIYLLFWILSGMSRTWQGNESAMVRDWLGMVAGISFYVLLFIQVIGVVQEDSLIDSTAFWRTRPISAGRLLAAKGMFIIGLSVVPLAGAALSWTFQTDQHAFPNWTIFFPWLCFALLSGGLAACTKDLIGCFLGLVICLIFFSVASAVADHWFRPMVLQQIHQMTQMLIHHQGTTLYRQGLPWFDHLPAFMVTEIIIGVAGTVAMLVQYSTRRTVVTFSLLLTAVLSAAVASSYCRCGALWGRPAENVLWGGLAESSAVKLDPQVKSILAGAAKFYAGENSFEADIDSFEANIDYVAYVKANAKNMGRHIFSRVALQRPASFSLVVTAGRPSCATISNGNNLITYWPEYKKYTSIGAPADLSELFNRNNFMNNYLALGFKVLWPQVSFETFEAKLRRSEYIGSEEIGGLAAQHVRLTETSCVADYWIADGPQPLLLQAQVIYYPQELSGQQTPWVATSTYTNWRINQPVAADTFQFQPPPEAKLVTKLFP